jgi:hypothetical protein
VTSLGGSSARTAGILIAVCSISAAAISVSAAGRTSATFDETVLVGGGVRGLERGLWGMVTDQPPLPMYAYGAAVRGAVTTLPPEPEEGWSFDDRWEYARALFFGMGNDTDALLGRARLVAALTGAALVAAAGGFAWWAAGPVAGVLAAAMTALLPDVLAHGGVAYNDLPMALMFLLAVWGLDAAVRRPTPTRAAVAGGAVAAALCTKLSALALGPVAVALVGLEAWRRGRDAPWWKAMAVTGVVGLLAGYVAMVVLYRGDPTLTLFRFNFYRTVFHVSEGHIAPAYLMGRTSETGFWYFFPVAALFKTPVAFQAALAGGAAVVLGGLWRRRAEWRAAVLRMAGWKGRGALLGALVFGAFLARSSLNAGFRYALPVLPMLAVVGAVVWARRWSNPRVRASVLALVLLQALSTLSVYPNFLAYTSLWAGGRDEGHRAVADLDWGQGLLELRDFMEEEGVQRVSLSYFGSAPPEAYGIEYVALPSFFRLRGGVTPEPGSVPRFTVISVTNLKGLYLQGRDPFAPYRQREPYRILGHTLAVFEEG